MSIEKFFLKFEGNDIIEHGIPISFFGDLLKSFQTYFRRIILMKHPNVKKNWITLILKEIGGGSAVTKIELKHPHLLMNETFQDSKDRALEIVKKFQIEDANKAFDEMKKVVENVADRIGIYRSLKKIWSIKRITTSIGSGTSYKDVEFVTLNPIYKTRIHKWLKREYYKGMTTIKGFLIRIKTDEPLSLTIKDEFGESINIVYKFKDLQKYKDLLTKAVKIKGQIELIGKLRTIKKLESIGELETIKIQRLSKVYLANPLVFTLRYYEDGIVLSEDTLPLNLDLEKLVDLEPELEEYLEFLKESYVDVDPNKLTSKARELRIKLIHLLSLEEH